MIAEILPLRKLPRTIDSFDYLVPEKLESKIALGQIIEAPFRNHFIKGLVLALKKSSPYKNIKVISKLIEEEKIITENQLSLARFVAGYYFTSLATVIKQIIPPILVKPRKIEKNNKAGKILSLKSKRKKQINNFLIQVVRDKKDKFLFHHSNQQDKILLFLKLIDYYFNKRKQVAIIFPEIIDFGNLLKFLPEKYRPSLAIYHRKLSQSQRNDNYFRIKSGQAKIIIGTPLTVFLPFKNLGLIIVDQEESINHKQFDQNPRFNDKKVAEEASRIYPAKLLLASVMPSLTTFYKVLKKKYHYLKLIDFKKDRISTVNLRYQTKDRPSTISEELEEEIRKKLQKKEKVILLLNRKGLASAILCRDCLKTQTCPNCHIPFTLYQKDNKSFLLCHRCGKKDESLLKCHYCHGTNLVNIGKGTQKVQKDIAYLFPKSSVKRFEGILKQTPKVDNLDIVITTNFILKKIAWQDFGLIALINADTLLNLPDFRSQERTFQILFKILNHAQKSPKAKLIIQTFSPLNPALKFFPDKFEYFLRFELKERKEYHYPPFSKLIKLIYRNKNKKMAFEKISQIYEKIKPSLPNSAEISPPLPAFIFKKHLKYHYQIIIKVPANIKNSVLQEFLKKIPSDYIIDIDPETLL